MINIPPLTKERAESEIKAFLEKTPVVCEWCGHKSFSNVPLPESITCNNCGKPIDLK